MTYDDVLTLNVSGEAGGTPTVYLDGTTVVASSFVDNGDGTYVVTTDPLANGLAGNLQATITDVAGNESVLSGPVTVSMNTAAPAKPVITSVTRDTNVEGDGVTNDNTLTLTITGESGATLALFQDGQEIVPFSVDEDGSGTYTVVTNVIADVTDSGLSVTLTDTAGNVSAPSDDYVVTVDIVSPLTPSVVLLNDSHNHADVAGDGSSDSDNLTKFDVLQLELTGEPGGTVTVYDGGTEMADAVVVENTAGVYSVTTVALADGQHDLSFTLTDTAGNDSPAAQLSVTVDTAAPALRLSTWTMTPWAM